jgi:23S rRNA pseudouridine1911/1915/1917 synthase
MPPVRNNSVSDGQHRIGGSSERPLDRALRELYPGASWNQLRRVIQSGKVRLNDHVCLEPTARVYPGDSIAVAMSTPRAHAGPPGLDAGALRYLDAELVVVDKPAGLSSVTHEDEPQALITETEKLLRRQARRVESLAPLGVVHRLDKQTSGLLVFARTLPAKRHLKQQFRFHTAQRTYLAIAHGRVRSHTFSSRLVADRGDGLRGSTKNPRLGRAAVTHVRLLAASAKASFIECRLETGRTHQIRIHLSEAGHPLVGERVYARGLHQPPPRTPLLEAPRVMLHAAELGFEHPTTGEKVHFTSPLPPDFQGMLAKLGLDAQM